MRYRSVSYRVLFAVLLLALLAAAAPVGSAAEDTGLEELVSLGDGRFSCAFDGVRHKFIVDLPEDPVGSPLILMLHGYGHTAESFRLETGLERDANPRGYTVVYVTGAPNPADRTSACGWNYGIGNSPNRDTVFLTALAGYVRRSFRTDESRCFAVGFSNGAFMAHRLALEAGDTFAAVVSVAGTVSETAWAARPETCAVGLLQITGEKDAVIPKHSDGSARFAKAPAIEDVVAYYVQANGLSLSETQEIGRASVLEKYTGEPAGPQVWHLLVRGGRHSWSAEPITGIDTNRLILDFLDTYTDTQ